jgi:hypothetical protein
VHHPVGTTLSISLPPFAKVALLIPILAGPVGLLNSFRVTRLPDPAPSSSAEALAWG